VIIPQEVCQQVGLQEGDFVDVQAVGGTVVIRPKKLVDADPVSCPVILAQDRGGTAFG
jgi:AbrB family looped-hinge helix DNA binding protein